MRRLAACCMLLTLAATLSRAFDIDDINGNWRARDFAGMGFHFNVDDDDEITGTWVFRNGEKECPITRSRILSQNRFEVEFTCEDRPNQPWKFVGGIVNQGQVINLEAWDHRFGYVLLRAR